MRIDTVMSSPIYFKNMSTCKSIFFLVMKFDTKFIYTCTLETFPLPSLFKFDHGELHREKVSTNIPFISKGILILSIPLCNIIYYILISPVKPLIMTK